MDLINPCGNPVYFCFKELLSSSIVVGASLRATISGRSKLVVKVSDRGRHVTSSSPVPLKTLSVEERCTLNLSRVQTSSRWCGS
ncbi:hypothetical protein TNCV_1283471 [Trichonephila clavipes]|uniref:Uncharacterized protein n=1 Tax=Trichonephila clavipes TaxID=2585209 RepID=A0A8X6SUS5_TRICX|nr:hypothetical protein TNCV_1283471 [Trichonephila clavipes]